MTNNYQFFFINIANLGTFFFSLLDLCKRVHEHDQELLDKMLPLLNQRINCTGKALADCVQVKDTINQWFV